MKLALTLAVLLVPMAACIGPGDRPSDTSPSTGLTDGSKVVCPDSVKDFNKDLCTGSVGFTLTLQGCESPILNYQVPITQSGLPAEWGGSGLTPLTASVYQWTHTCSSGNISGQAVGAIALAVTGGLPANYPQVPPSNYSGSATYVTGLFTDNQVVADYLAWIGFPASAASITVTGSQVTTTTWTSGLWSTSMTCADPDPSDAQTRQSFFWHGPLDSALTIDILLHGPTGTAGPGTTQAMGGIVGDQLAPLGAGTGTCANAITETLALRLL
jgi:hypothetical protein